MREVIIVGGGLVGSLASVFFSRRGYAVELFEKRSDMRTATAAGGRSINLVVTNRGLRALACVGLEPAARELTVPVYGRMIHAVTGDIAYQPYGRDETECNYSISRADLNRFLLDAAEASGARLRFEHGLVGIDRVSAACTFETPGGGRAEVGAGAVIGADGAGSAVRAALARSGGVSEDVELLPHGYKELTIPAGPDGASLIERNALHIWPRGDSMLMALPNLDGSFTVTLYLPRSGPGGFDALGCGNDVLALFEREFPDAIPLIPDLVEDFARNPTGELGTVRCDPWNVGRRVLLLGDAAHAIVPFFGQGMNAGFEDCRLLDERTTAEVGDDPGRAFPAFAGARKPDADAIADLALENFVEMRDSVGDPQFLLRKAVEHRLETAFPAEYRTRYSMVMYSHIPFRLARQAGQVQRELLDELCAGLASADDLDLDAARAAVRRRFAPFLERNAIRLDY